MLRAGFQEGLQFIKSGGTTFSFSLQDKRARGLEPGKQQAAALRPSAWDSDKVAQLQKVPCWASSGGMTAARTMLLSRGRVPRVALGHMH